MKKDRSTFAKFLPPSRRAAVGIGVSLAVALALSGALSSCDLFTYKDPFPPEYYADNWIDAIGFDQFVGTVFPAPAAPVTGSWDFEYRYDNWTANDGFIEFVAAAAPYDTATAVAAAGSETLPAGLPAAAPVYRLELVNLISGGDFEAGTGGTWTPTASPVATCVRDTTGSITGVWSMRLSADKYSSIEYVPSLIFAGAIVDGREYHYSVNAAYDAAFSIKDANGNIQSSQSSSMIGGSYQRSSTNNYMLITPALNQSFGAVLLDDLRLTRSKSMRFRLRLCPGETKYDMQKGAYRFTVWAHLDPTVSTAGNPYNIDSFTVTMIVAGNADKQFSSTTATYTASGATAGWVKLTINSDAGALMFDETVLDQPVLDIVMDFNAAHSGRVLLAAPELRYGRSY